MQRLFLIISAISGAIVVALGAFGAHALRSTLEANQRMDTFNTAIKYHMFHTIGLIAIAILLDKFPSRTMEMAGWSMIAGMLLFSGALYVLSIANAPKLGIVAPFGGLAMILGWVLLLLSVLRSS